MVDGPVSLETVGLDADTIVDEGRALAKVADNVVVKVPIMKEGLVAVKRLAAEGIKTNVTVTFSPAQALLAAKVGASYISPFVGRLDNVATEGMELAREIRQIYDNYGYETEIIVAAVRHPMHVLESALIGADIATMSYDVLMKLYDHPLTDAGIDQFLKDWDKVPK
jgi:transaldolase